MWPVARLHGVPVQAKDEAGKSFDDYWKPSVTLLGDKDLINRLKSYDKDNIPPKCALCDRRQPSHCMHVFGRQTCRTSRLGCA
jgi:hypothetical protein